MREQAVQQIGWNEMNRAANEKRRKLFLLAGVLAGLVAMAGIGFLGLRAWREYRGGQFAAAGEITPETDAEASSPGAQWWRQYQPPAAAPTPMTNDIFYVSPRGSDTNSGRQNSPWRTVQKSLERLKPGQTLYLRAGMYREGLDIRNGGAAQRPIAISGFPGEKAILDGTGLNWKYGIELHGAISHIIIQNLTIRNYPEGFGIGGWDDEDNITLRDLNFSKVGTPIKMAAAGDKKIVRSGIYIENVTASDYAYAGFDFGPGAVSDVTIRNVTLNGQVGGNETAIDGIAVEQGARVFIENAKVIGHPGDGIDLKADDATVRRCEVRDFGRNGVKLWGINSALENNLVASTVSPHTILALAGAGPYYIRNNLFRGGPGHSYMATLGPDKLPKGGRTPITLQGNIFYSPENDGTLLVFSTLSYLQADSGYNIYYVPRRLDRVMEVGDGTPNGRVFVADQINKGQWAAFLKADRNSRFMDPLLVDPNNGNYELQARSPALDVMPAALTPTVDLLGRKRPAGVRSDIGPYEKQ
jgi:hypothetical protein